ncbi:HD domain-containing protein [Candidatus Phytoplasma solani]|uniref:HD domain-containing protein n=1 Tax=Candidatus Phytoplasma solani TaxID=69896 RepID=UPI0032D9F660
MNNNNIIAKQKDKINHFIGKVTSINQGNHFHNITLQLTNKIDINIKLAKETLNPLQGKIYCFQTICLLDKEELIFMNQNFTLAQKILDPQTLYDVFISFFQCAPVSFAIIATNLEKYLAKIKNKILKEVTTNLYFSNKTQFLIAKAALKMHHNYYGGLGYHTLNMLKIAEIILKIYPFLNHDLLYSGIILHDMAKIKEIDVDKKNYTKEGKLLGHLVMITCDLEREANLLGYQKTEEILLLKHILIANHGLLEYGAAKKPQIAEALLIWHLDNIDAKLTVLEETLQKTDIQTFTEPIPVLEKNSFYKPFFDKNNDDFY